MKMIYGVKDKPAFGKRIIFAIQQLLAIMAATLVVPVITNNATGSDMSSAAALFGAGVGTLVYLLFTKFRSPVFLGSSFAFLGSMAAAFAGASSMSLGYVGLILGAFMAGLVYVIIAVIVRFAGVNWLNKLMPTLVIGPTVAIIGLSLAGNAIGDLTAGSVVNAEGAALAVIFQDVHHPEALLIVPEGPSQALGQRRLARVAKRGMPHIMAHGNRLGKILVEAQSPGNGTGDPGYLQGMGHPGTVMVSLRAQKHLGLVHQPPECFAMYDPVRVPLVAGAHILLPRFAGPRPAPAFIRKRRQWV